MTGWEGSHTEHDLSADSYLSHSSMADACTRDRVRQESSRGAFLCDRQGLKMGATHNN